MTALAGPRQEHLLGQIGRVRRRVGQAECKLVERLVIPPDQFVEIESLAHAEASVL